MVNRVSIILFCTFSCFFNTFGQTRKVVFPIGTYHSKATKIIGVSVGLWEKNKFKDSDTSQTKTVGLRLEVPGFGWAVMILGGCPISDSEREHEERLKNRPKFSEIVDGLSISAMGVMGNMKINGISINGQCGLIEDGNGLMASMIVNYSENYQGIMMSIMLNDVYEMNGIQLAAVGNHVHIFSGLQVAYLNTAIQLKGVQIGGHNKSDEANGVQIGLLNNAKKMRGVQIGFFNNSQKTHGFQFGLLNKNEKRVLPFINWNFK